MKHKPLILLLLTLMLLVGFDYLNAWTAPNAVAPNGNVAAPVNTGGIYQAKLADLGAIRMRAGRYCDAAGLNCWDPTTGFPGGNSLPVCTKGDSLVAGANGTWNCSTPNQVVNVSPAMSVAQLNTGNAKNASFNFISKGLPSNVISAKFNVTFSGSCSGSSQNCNGARFTWTSGNSGSLSYTQGSGSVTSSFSPSIRNSTVALTFGSTGGGGTNYSFANVSLTSYTCSGACQ